MKKALITLVVSLIILGALLGFDIAKCDGNVLLKPLLGLETSSDYNDVVLDDSTVDATTGKAKDQTYAEKKLSVTASKPQNTLKEATVESTLDEDMPQEIEVDSTSDAERGYEFYFPLLSEEEKAVYRIVYDAFSQVKSGVAIPTVDDDTMNKVVNAVKNDHPEVFYLDQIGYTHYTMGGQIQRTTLSVTFSDTKAMIETKQRMVDAVVDEIVATIPSGADDYTKVKAVYEAIINNTQYNSAAPDNQTMISALLNKSSVCAGYSRSMQYILNSIGVPTTVVEGVSLFTGEQHAWNLCKLEDGYYYVDVTWGDASYVNNGRNGAAGEQLNYDYLLVTEEEICRTHGIDRTYSLPECNLNANNYFVREGLFISEYNPDEVKTIFDRGYSNGQATVSFKCANLEIYDEVCGDLIKKSRVFDMLDPDTETISYVVDEEQRTLCFWL